MNKPLIGKIIGCCAFATASVISIINFKSPEETKKAELDSTYTEVAELDAEAPSVSHKVEETKEESAQGSAEVAPTTQSNSQVKTTTTKAITTAKAQTAAKPVATQSTQTRYTSAYDF